MMCEGGALSDWLIESVHRMQLTNNESVMCWLVDLRSITDAECMCILQGKSLTIDTAEVVFAPPKSVVDHIDSILHHGHVITTSCAKLSRRLQNLQWKKFHKVACRMMNRIEELLKTCNSSLPTLSSQMQQSEQQVNSKCKELRDYIDRFVEVSGHRADSNLIAIYLTAIRDSVDSTVNCALFTHMQTLLDQVRSGSSSRALVTALQQITSIGIRHGNKICHIVASIGGISQLVDLLYDESLQRRQHVLTADVQAQVLRTLATLCCVEDCLTQFYEAGGVDCLCDILCEGGRATSDTVQMSQRVRCEAAGVLAQILSPTFSGSELVTAALYASFMDNMADLVQALTVLCDEASSHEVFLLSCAALANMAVMDSLTCDFMVIYSTVKVLVTAASRPVAQSLFAKDQVVTVLASMASLESCYKSLTTDICVAELLVQFLHERPRTGSSSVELAACQRLQQKSAIAVSRLCQNDDIGLIFIELHCVPRLVELCSNPLQRNHDDAVLVACLTALRKLCMVCGTNHESLQGEDVQQLVHYSIVDSFLQHTSANESFI